MCYLFKVPHRWCSPISDFTGEGKCVISPVGPEWFVQAAIPVEMMGGERLARSPDT